MIKNKLIAFITIVSLMMCSMVNMTAFADSEADYVFNTSFSDTQGTDCWYYMRYPTNEAFAEENCRNLGYRKNGVYDRFIWSNSGNPPYILQYTIDYADGTTSEKDYSMLAPSTDTAKGNSAIVWKAPESGFVKLGTIIPIQKKTPNSANMNCYIYHSSKLLWKGYLDGSANSTLELPDISIYVEKDENIYFTADKHSGSGDAIIVFDPTITYVEKESFSSTEDYSAANGNFGWQYVYAEKTTSHKESAYKPLTYTDSKWQVDETDYIDGDTVNAESYKIGYAWESYREGKLKIAVEAGALSEGCKWSLYKKNSCIMSSQDDENEVYTNFKKGDKLYCILENGEAALDVSLSFAEDDYEVTCSVMNGDLEAEGFSPGDQLTANISVTDKNGRGKNLFVAMCLINEAGKIEAQTIKHIINSEIGEITASIDIPEDAEGGELFIYVWEEFPSVRPVFAGKVLKN